MHSYPVESYLIQDYYCINIFTLHNTGCYIHVHATVTLQILDMTASNSSLEFLATKWAAFNILCLQECTMVHLSILHSFDKVSEVSTYHLLSNVHLKSGESTSRWLALFNIPLTSCWEDCGSCCQTPSTVWSRSFIATPTPWTGSQITVLERLSTALQSCDMSCDSPWLN